jgi:hypothetical protein
MRRRLWAARGRETYVPLKPRRGRRGPARSRMDWAAVMVEGFFGFLTDLLFFWERR